MLSPVQVTVEDCCITTMEGMEGTKVTEYTTGISKTGLPTATVTATSTTIMITIMDMITDMDTDTITDMDTDMDTDTDITDIIWDTGIINITIIIIWPQKRCYGP
ncbi:uncharacterized protein LOC125235261 [Leguminivora glycinivorella]|uniref:uncharacterized protein LOC125235261 n=1 Tax=Leguminivora glycinivorella TaxID=1035111 RepID=UPI00200E02EA|nr:uncharacterized protein LOC125235261 [Leguminivora glycinivorella]